MTPNKQSQKWLPIRKSLEKGALLDTPKLGLIPLNLQLPSDWRRSPIYPAQGVQIPKPPVCQLLAEDSSKDPKRVPCSTRPSWDGFL